MAKRPKQPVETHESFLFEVVSSSPYYSFGLAHRPDEPDPYSEYSSWKIEARCLHPARFAGRIAQFDLLGKRALTTEMRDRKEFIDGPHGVGLLDAGKSRFSVLATLPIDALWAIASGLASGSVRYVATHGPRVARGKALVTSIRFEGASLNLSDWE